MADIGMAALSVFLMQSPSFLAHQRALAEGRARSNAHTLFGLARIPCDNHVRQRLGTRFRLFEHLRTVTEYQVFPSWTALMTLLATGGPAAQPP